MNLPDLLYEDLCVRHILSCAGDVVIGRVAIHGRLADESPLSKLVCTPKDSKLDSISRTRKGIASARHYCNSLADENNLVMAWQGVPRTEASFSVGSNRMVAK